jgi:hypothetical protein
MEGLLSPALVLHCVEERELHCFQPAGFTRVRRFQELSNSGSLSSRAGGFMVN